MGGLDALPALYGRVLVPEAVLWELEAGARLDDTPRRLRTVPGIEVYALATGVSPLLAGELDLGEAAVIQLALDLPGATVVLDDLKARRVARQLYPDDWLLGRAPARQTARETGLGGRGHRAYPPAWGLARRRRRRARIGPGRGVTLTVRSNNSKSSGLKSRPRSCPYTSLA